jgi:hypothetical protein
MAGRAAVKHTAPGAPVVPGVNPAAFTVVDQPDSSIAERRERDRHAPDVDGDIQVEVDDLVAGSRRGGRGRPGRARADVNGDGQVNVNDLVAVIVAWS